MAIEMGYNFKGIEANYWKITNYQVDALNNKTFVEMSLYANEKARKQDVKNVLTTVTVEVIGVDFNREQLYAEIIKLDGWINSKSV